MLDIDSSCWLNVVISWLNLFVFSLCTIDFYRNYRGTDYFLLPITIINITGVVALTLLLFCLTELPRKIKAGAVIVVAAPSVLVIILFVFFIFQQAVNCILFFTQ